MTTVTIESVNDRGVKPEGAGWANYSTTYEGPRPLVAGQTYDVDISSWIGKRDGKEMWFLNKATEAGAVHAPPPPPTVLPPVVGTEGEAHAAGQRPPPSPALPPVAQTSAKDTSIERQVCLKAAVEIAIANLQVNVAVDGAVAAGSINAEDVAGDAEILCRWISGETLYQSEPPDQEAQRQAGIAAYQAGRDPGPQEPEA